MFKETNRIIQSELGRIDDDLRLFNLPQYPDIRQPMASQEQLREMRAQLFSIYQGHEDYMQKHGSLYDKDECFLKAERRHNRLHTHAILALFIVQLIVLLLTLIITGNCKNSSDGSDNGKKEDVSLVIDAPYVIDPFHGDFELEQGMPGIVDFIPVNNHVPFFFELIHACMHPVHVLLIATMTYHRPFVGIEPIKGKHEFPGVCSIPFQ